MKVMEHFEQIGSRGFYRPVARVSFENAIDLVAEAIQTRAKWAWSICW